MKKILKAIGNIFAMLIICLAGAGGGLLLSLSLFSGFFNIGEVIIGIVGILVTFYISLIVHEAGHLVFGIMSGYGFSSFRIGSLMWIKQDNKIKLRRLSIAGTGGQCLMIPPEEKEGRTPVVLFNLGGVIANIVLSALFGVLYFLSLRIILLALVFLFGAIISFIIAITNGLPLNIGGIANDGMNVIHLSKDSIAANSFRNQLLMSAAQSREISLSDMPDEWFTLPEGADMQNIHNASIAVFSASRTLEKCDMQSAESEIKSLLASDYNIVGLHRNLLKCDLVFARLINYGRSAEISSLLTMDQLKFMKSMKTFPSVLRTEYAIALLRDNDESRALKIKEEFEKISAKYPYPADIKSERKLMDAALESYKNNI